MKPKPPGYIVIVLMSFCLASCNQGLYVPAFQNVPLFQKKGEIYLMVDQTNFQGAIAVSNNIGVAMNGQHVNASSRAVLSNFTPASRELK